MRALICVLLLSASPLLAEEKVLVEADMNAIRTAMQMFHLDTNHLTTIENLDDVWTSNTPHQSINSGGGALVINPSVGIPFRRFLTLEEFFGPYLSYSSGRAREGPDGDHDEGTPQDLTGTG